MNNPVWSCLDEHCSEKVICGYRQLAIKGPPFCPECKSEMGISTAELKRMSEIEKAVEKLACLLED